MIWSILIISAVTVIYTVLGGLKAVVVTETIQTFLLLGGAVLITVLGHPPSAGGRGPQLRGIQGAARAEPVEHDPLDLRRQGPSQPYSWLAILLGYPVLGIWYWCSDQTIVQRVLGSRSERDGQNGALFAGFLKILPLFLMVVPGVIAFGPDQERRDVLRPR